MKNTTCAKCEGTMEVGFSVHTSIDGARQDKWLPGEPQKSMLLGIKVDVNQWIPITTYRCESCGFLESYAKGSTPA
ncbi:MAG: hypothetical protein ABGY95_12145 [Rubritalea sp.]|uniref:hypothetical protein n=1 Tax=Rubritalea sp. TaxID=2109375 RepID=UPI003241DFB7